MAVTRSASDKNAARTTMTIDLEFQNASASEAVPDPDTFETWLSVPLAGIGDVSLAMRVVDRQEMQTLNSRYRGQDRPTNVLSFPSDLPPEVKKELEWAPLGDIVMCAAVVEAEAEEQDKPVFNHWAHLTIHGLLHLLGHDHQDENQAQAMESLEIAYLSSLGISDPYGD
jgi:probable rRNA maturation factor